MKPDVMLPRNLTELLIKWHGLFSSLFCHSDPAGAGEESLINLKCFASLNMTKLQIASPVLLFLERFEQRFEITFAETLGAFALNDFEEQRRTIFHRLGEDLQQISLVVAIDQNAESLQGLKVFVDVADTSGQLIVIG